MPGVLVVLPCAPLWYGDAAYLVERLEAGIDADDSPPRALVVDADAMSDIDYTASE